MSEFLEHWPYLILACSLSAAFCWCLCRASGRDDHVSDELSGALDGDLTTYVASLNKKDAA